MNIKLIPFQLKFNYPFRIAHTSREFTDNAYLVLEDGYNVGIGEAVFPPYVKENFFTLNKIVQKYKPQLEKLTKETYKSFLLELFNSNKEDTAAVACIDMVVNEFFSVQNSSLGAGQEKTFDSSYTIGLCSRIEFEQKIEENADQAYFKLKIDQANYTWILGLYKKICSKPFVLDANQGFTEYAAGVSCAKMAADLGVKYLEQVFDKHNLQWHKQLKEENILPIIADESFQTFGDLEKISGSFDGVNIKLMKCGGLLQAKRILNYCQTHQLKTVLGCMSDSIIAIQHAEQLAPVADWVDLDGHLLNANNPSRKFLLNL